MKNLEDLLLDLRTPNEKDEIVNRVTSLRVKIAFLQFKNEANWFGENENWNSFADHSNYSNAVDNDIEKIRWLDRMIDRKT